MSYPARAPWRHVAAALLLCPATLLALGSTPPPGPPWIEDFGEAQKKALEEGKPIFLYFTKTY